MGRVPAEVISSDEDLVVAEVFGPTFQGEGPSVGRRSAFVRLGRCNLDCSWCDTPYTWDWRRFDPAQELRTESVPALLSRLEEMVPDLVVVTGGEPLLQQRNLALLVEGCAARGWPVEVETNGTLRPSDALRAGVARWNVSPKLANSGVPYDSRVKPAALGALLDTGSAVFKFVVAEPPELDEVAELAARFGLAPVWIMPEGTNPADVLDRARALAGPVLERGWNLTPRWHVLLWGDERGR